jgi:acetyl esterase/lipase
MSETLEPSGAGLPDFRRMPVRDAIAWLSAHGEPPDPRPDIDTASLVRRFPHLATVEAEDLTFAGPRGAIPARAYRDPSAAPTGAGLVWVHGGAFIGGHLDMPEANWVARELASRGIPVLSVDYRKCLSGNHYPVPTDDVEAAWRAAREVALSVLGADPGRLHLGGASAGAALAAGVTTGLVATGGPEPAGVVLVYPTLHPNGPAASSQLDPESVHAQLTMNYSGGVETFTDPRAFAGVGSGEGFPPTLIVVCERDELRPSGEAFARLLQGAGRPVTLYLEAEAEHGHIDHPGDPGALRTIEAMAQWLTRSTGNDAA